MRLDVWGHSVVGLVRKRNEDAFAIDAQHGIFVVADGLGAHPQGDRASRLCVDVITQMLVAAAERVSPADAAAWTDALATALTAAHQRLQSASIGLLSQAPYLPMASTAVALVLRPPTRQAYWSHNGDSRLYRLRARQLQLLTADHTSYGDCHRDAQVIPLDLTHTNTLNQALGIEGRLDLRGTAEALNDGDVFLLCSDGISGMVEPDRISRTLADGYSAQAAGTALLDAAMQAGGRDNATLVVVRVAAD